MLRNLNQGCKDFIYVYVTCLYSNKTTNGIQNVLRQVRETPPLPTTVQSRSDFYSWRKKRHVSRRCVKRPRASPHAQLCTADDEGSFVDVLLICDVLNNFIRSHQLLRFRVGNLKTELVLHGHDDLHLVETVQAQILHEVRRDLQLLWVDLVVQFEDVEDAVSDRFQG